MEAYMENVSMECNCSRNSKIVAEQNKKEEIFMKPENDNGCICSMKTKKPVSIKGKEHIHNVNKNKSCRKCSPHRQQINAYELQPYSKKSPHCSDESGVCTSSSETSPCSSSSDLSDNSYSRDLPKNNKNKKQKKKSHKKSKPGTFLGSFQQGKSENIPGKESEKLVHEKQVTTQKPFISPKQMSLSPSQKMSSPQSKTHSEQTHSKQNIPHNYIKSPKDAIPNKTSNCQEHNEYPNNSFQSKNTLSIIQKPNQVTKRENFDLPSCCKIQDKYPDETDIIDDVPLDYSSFIVSSKLPLHCTRKKEVCANSLSDEANNFNYSTTSPLSNGQDSSFYFDDSLSSKSPVCYEPSDNDILYNSTLKYDDNGNFSKFRLFSL